MKLKIEIDEKNDEEIVIRAPEFTDDIRKLSESISRLAEFSSEVAVYDNDSEIYLNVKDILFFETGETKVFVHTQNECYICAKKLYELEEVLPRFFVRASKASIVNTMKIRSMQRSLTGVTDVKFFSSQKSITISRMYYHSVRDTIEEMRLK